MSEINGYCPFYNLCKLRKIDYYCKSFPKYQLCSEYQSRKAKIYTANRDNLKYLHKPYFKTEKEIKDKSEVKKSLEKLYGGD